MILTDVLSAEDVQRVREGLKDVAFRDGAATAGKAARAVKNNEQSVPEDAKGKALARFVRQALERHAPFVALARPIRWSTIMFSRYGPGQQYGLHTDNAVMVDETGHRFRSDLSFTLFLADPETYEGGALILDDLDGGRTLKPKAGSAVLYSTGQLHRVEPIVSGQRIAAVGWVQSAIRRQDQRELLYDLERVRFSLKESEVKLTLSKAIGNLMRQWADT